MIDQNMHIKDEYWDDEFILMYTDRLELRQQLKGMAVVAEAFLCEARLMRKLHQDNTVYLHQARNRIEQSAHRSIGDFVHKYAPKYVTPTVSVHKDGPELAKVFAELNAELNIPYLEGQHTAHEE